MKIKKLSARLQRALSLISISLVLVSASFWLAPVPADAACTAPATDYGSVTMTVNVSTAGTYRVWSRIMAPDSTNNSYLLEVDGGTCITVGDSAIAANDWTWVDYQGGSTSTKTSLTLSAGNHTLKAIGLEPNVKLDRILLLSDTACTPTSNGDNCVTSTDTSAPTVSLTAPANNATVTGPTTLAATASDNVGVTRVEFLVDGTIVNTDTTSPYSFSWDSASVVNGSHSITAKAYDAAGNAAVSNAVTVNVSQSSLPATSIFGNPIAGDLQENPSTDYKFGSIFTLSNSGNLADFKFYAQGGNASQKFIPVIYNVDGSGNPTSLLAQGSEVTVNANQAAGWVTATLTATRINPGRYLLGLLSGPTSGSAKLYYSQVTDAEIYNHNGGYPNPTNPWGAISRAHGNWSFYVDYVPTQPTDTTAPSTPTNLSATAAAYNKVNLSWTASTDNVGVTGYYIVRGGSTIAQVTGTAYSDTAVTANTQYAYQVIAYDAAGNNSTASNTATVTTPQAPDTQAPSTPTNLTANAVSSSQINLSWTASTDNIGVTGYDVYRAGTKIATVTTTSFGDTGLTASTNYSYYVIAKDAAGNSSPASNTANATTQAQITTGSISGTVTGTSGPLVNVKVSLSVNGIKQTYKTNSSGIYTIPNLPPGSYTMTFQIQGYRNQQKTVTVTSGLNTVLNVTMQRK